jgi:hypothetical protein
MASCLQIGYFNSLQILEHEINLECVNQHWPQHNNGVAWELPSQLISKTFIENMKKHEKTFNICQIGVLWQNYKYERNDHNNIAKKKEWP